MLKDIIRRDIDNVLMNTSDFAENAVLNGATVPCVLFKNLSSGRETRFLDSYDKTFTDIKTLYIKSEYVSTLNAGDKVILNDEYLKVISVIEEYGMTKIDLSRPICVMDKHIEVYSYVLSVTGGFEKKTLTYNFECMANVNFDPAREIMREVNMLKTFVSFRFAYNNNTKNIKNGDVIRYDHKDYSVLYNINVMEEGVISEVRCTLIE